MYYMVMECHPGYAIVLDNAGKFIKVANLGYQVGQIISDVTQMNITSVSDFKRKRTLKRIYFSVGSIAACLCLILFGVWNFLITPYGTVRMQINPDIRMTVNRMDYVIDIEGLNTDGENLIENYNYTKKDIECVSDELADRAVQMGYLQKDGVIKLKVTSDNKDWQTETEERLITELKIHIGDFAEITSDTSPVLSDETEIVIPIKPRSSIAPAPSKGVHNQNNSNIDTQNVDNKNYSAGDFDDDADDDFSDDADDDFSDDADDDLSDDADDDFSDENN